MSKTTAVPGVGQIVKDDGTALYNAAMKTVTEDYVDIAAVTILLQAGQLLSDGIRMAIRPTGLAPYSSMMSQSERALENVSKATALVAINNYLNT